MVRIFEICPQDDKRSRSELTVKRVSNASNEGLVRQSAVRLAPACDHYRQSGYGNTHSLEYELTDLVKEKPTPSSEERWR